MYWDFITISNCKTHTPLCDLEWWTFASVKKIQTYGISPETSLIQEIHHIEKIIHLIANIFRAVFGEWISKSISKAVYSCIMLKEGQNYEKSGQLPLSKAFEQQSCDYGTEIPVPFDSSYLSKSINWTSIDIKTLCCIQSLRICNQCRMPWSLLRCFCALTETVK